MLKTVINKEFKEIFGGAATKWIFIVLYTLYAFALYRGINYYTTLSIQHKEAEKESYRQWLNQGAKNPHSAAHYGFYAYKPLAPTAILDKGMEDYLGQVIWLEAHNQNEVKDRFASDSGSFSRFGDLTIAFLFLVLVPLGIILLSFNIMNKEHELGTIRMLLSSNASLQTIVKGKVIAVYKVVLWLVLPLFLATIQSVFFTVDKALFFQFLPNLLLLFFIYLLYFLFWTILGTWISKVVRSSSVALSGLLSFWLVGVFIIPRLSGSVSKTSYPTPSAFDFTYEIKLDKELGIDRKTSEELRENQLKEQVLKKYGVDSIEKLPINFTGLRLQEGEEYAKKVYKKNYGRLFSTFERQRELMHYMNLLSPALAMRNLSNALTATDMDKHLGFALQAEKHRQLIQKVMNGDLEKNGAGTTDYKSSDDFWKIIPPFSYTDANILSIVKNQSISLTTLIFWCLASIFLLFNSKKASSI